MRSSDTPETDPLQQALDEFRPRQGPADWSRETPSDDQLSEQARERIAAVLRQLADRETTEP